MELFGIPVFFIIIVIILIVADYNKKKEETNKKWNSISVGMSKNEVMNTLGNAPRVWKAGVAEIWCYGSSDSDGIIKFVNGKVVSCERPV